MDKRTLKRKLGDLTNCGIQHNGWTCGTCFGAAMRDLKVQRDKRHLYWQSLLVYRGDYKPDTMDYPELTLKQGIKELKGVLNGL